MSKQSSIISWFCLILLMPVVVLCGCGTMSMDYGLGSMSGNLGATQGGVQDMAFAR